MQKIQILEDLDHIRKRKGMYIGSSEDITHLIEEVLDNALDEVVNGHADTVYFIKDKDMYTVIDNGRGLPVYHDDKYQQDIPVLLCTKLFSGGKFNKENYEVSVGLNGVGLVVVNALSNFMRLEIYHECKTIKENKKLIFGIDDKKLNRCKSIKFTYTFKNSLLKERNVEYFENERLFSTKISFIPNKKYFNKISYDKDFIKNRLKIASIYTGAKIIWRHDKKENIIEENLESYFKENIKFKEKIFLDPIKLSYKNKKNSEGIDLILTWNLNESNYQMNASVNLLPVNQGTHINQLNLILQNLFYDFRDKYKYTFNKLDSLIGIRYYFNIYLINTDFSSQTKEKLITNKKEFEYIFDDIYKQLKNYFQENEEKLLILLEKFQEYRDRQSTKKTVRHLIGNSNIRGITNKDSRLRDCTTPSVEKSELLICEGESASGSLTKCRDYKKHAVLPLKGKTINVVSNDMEKVLKNKEIVDIIKSIGVGLKLKPEDKLQLDKIRYGKIIIMADADPDGGHISCLLMAAFLKFIPEVIQEGFIYICIPPLYGLRGKNEYYTFHSKDEMDNFIKENNIDLRKYQLLRYKGLGEMNPEEMKVAAINEKTRKLIRLQYPENEDQLNEIFYLLSSADAKKKLVVRSD